MSDIGSLYETDDTPTPTWPYLCQQTYADVAIIGGGLTGISTALHLAREGVSTVVLESHTPGYGASGRNGGQVNPGLKPTPDEVEADFGPERGTRLVNLAWNAPDLVFDLITHYGLKCNAKRGGTIRAATATSQLASLKSLMEQCSLRGGSVQWLDANAMHERTGTSLYPGGMLDMRGGQLDPLAYTQGLATAAINEGARIYANSHVISVRQSNGKWLINTRHGSVIAQKVVMATNGYTGTLWNKLRRSIVPVYSSIVATEPLPQSLRQRILAQHEVLYELGQITTYYRVDTSGRFLMGGRSYSHPAHNAASFPHLVDRACAMWPELKSVQWTHGWNGQLAITLDHYPHWHEPAPGFLSVLGYNGRGVALATVMGREIALWLQNKAEPLFPITPVQPIPAHAFWKVGVAGRIWLGRLQDRVEKLL